MVARYSAKLTPPRELIGGHTSRGAYERTLVEKVNYLRLNGDAARAVLLSLHRIPLKEFTALRKKPENKGGLYPVWGVPWVQPPSRPSEDDAERLFWTWVGLMDGYTPEQIKLLKEETAWTMVHE